MCIILFLSSLSFLPDLSLQDSLFLEYKKLGLSVQSVRIVPSGRSGRYAVIYFACKSDVLKALDETSRSSLLSMGEAHVFLADDELVNDE